MKTIVVAVDSSKVAPLVLEKALMWADALHAKVILFQAVSLPVEIPPEVYAKPQEQLPAILVREVREELEQLRQSQQTSVSIEVRVEIGVPWQAICDVASKEQAEMIVIGSHGYRWYEKMLGSTATRVLHHADRTVVVVK